MTNSPAPVLERLPQLDALRAVAAVFVVLFHYDMAFGGLTIFQHSQLAVDFFFLLSGFVLSAGIERRCHDLASGANILVERIGRLWPMMAVGSALGFAASVLDGASFASGATLLLALLFIPGRTPREAIFPLNGAQWSLLFELIANAMHALILWRLRTRMLVVLAGISWLALAAMAYDKGEIAYGPMAPGWQLGILRIGFAYIAGCAMGRHAEDIARVVKAPWWLPTLVLCLALIRPGREQLIDGAGDLVTLLVFPLVLALALRAHPPRALHTPMCIAGAASWPLYALHLPILNGAKALATQGLLAQNIGAPLAATLAIALSLLIGQSRLAKGIRLPLHRGLWARRRATLASV